MGQFLVIRILRYQVLLTYEIDAGGMNITLCYQGRVLTEFEGLKGVPLYILWQLSALSLTQQGYDMTNMLQ